MTRAMVNLPRPRAAVDDRVQGSAAAAYGLCPHVSSRSEEQWPWRAVFSLGPPSPSKTLSCLSMLLPPAPAGA